MKHTLLHWFCCNQRPIRPCTARLLLKSYLLRQAASVLTGDTKTLAWVDEIMGQIDKSNRDTNYNPANQLGQSGFAPIFRDPGLGGNQPHHFWFYVQMGFQQSKLKNAPSAIFPYLAVIGHETLLTKSQAGNSFQDLALGFEGVNLGADLWAGAISPSDVGNYVRENFNPLSQTAVNWSCHAETFFSFLWALGY